MGGNSAPFDAHILFSHIKMHIYDQIIIKIGEKVVYRVIYGSCSAIWGFRSATAAAAMVKV